MSKSAHPARSGEESFADRFALLLQGKSQRAYATLVGVSEGSVRNWVGGKTPSDKEMRNLARHHGVRIEWLRDGEGDMYEPGEARAAAESRGRYHPGAGYDVELLRNAIAAVEQFCVERGLAPEVEQKAAAITAVYSMVQAGVDAHMRSVSVVMEQLLTA